jgi:hypothetical protein
MRIPVSVLGIKPQIIIRIISGIVFIAFSF